MDDGQDAAGPRRVMRAAKANAKAGAEAGAEPKRATRSVRKGKARAPRYGQEVIVPLRERHDGWTPIRQRTFLRALSELASVGDACKLIGLSKTSAYRLRKLWAEFAAAWDKALEIVAPILEQAAFERGVQGWDEPIFYQGEVCGYRKRYSDNALKMLMQARKVTPAPVTAEDMMPSLETASKAELEAFAQKAASRAGGWFNMGMTQEQVDAALLERIETMRSITDEEAEENRRKGICTCGARRAAGGDDGGR